MAHSIVVSLLMATGSFETDTKRAERALAKFQKQAVTTGKVVGTALAAGAIAAAYAFDRLVKSAADFQDLSEMTGAQADDLASLAVAAGTAGVEMEALAGNAIRLTKNLTGVDDDSKAAGAAIKALGLDLASFKALDPVAQIDALGAAFAGFADGPEKAAVAVALWGKSGAEMLKLLKALEEQGGRTKVLTREQIENADAYADAQAKAAAQLRLYAQAAATEALPAFSELTNAAGTFIRALFDVDDATGQLNGSSAIQEFARRAVDALALVVDAGDGVARTFAIVGKTIGASAAQAAAVARGEFAAAVQIGKEWLGDVDAILNRTTLSAQVAMQRAQAAARAAVNPGKMAGMLGINAPMLQPPRLDFQGAGNKSGNAGGARQQVDQAAKALADLQREIQVFGQDDTLARMLGFQDLQPTVAQFEAYKAALADLGAAKAAAEVKRGIEALEAERDALVLNKEQLTARTLALQGATGAQVDYAVGLVKSAEALRAHAALMEEGKRLTESMRTPAEELGATQAHLNELLQAGAIDWETYSRAVFDAQDTFDAATKAGERAASTLDDFAKNAAENIQRSFGDTLVDAMEGNWKNIGDGFTRMVTRMVAEAASAQIARALFGGDAKGGVTGTGGMFGDALKAFGSMLGFAAGGSPPVNQPSIVGERGPELFVPRTAGTILPAQQTSALLAGGTRNFNITIAPPAGMDARTSAQFARDAARQIAAAVGRGNA